MNLFRKPAALTKVGKTRGWAAIFFGETAVELTTARPAGDQVDVERQVSAPLPPATEGSDPKRRFDTAVQQLRAQVDPGKHHIVTSIGGEDVLCQTLRLPTADPAELKQMLDLQIDNLTPLPVDEAVYSFEPLETIAGETRVLVAVARKAAVNERVAALEAVGLPAEAVGIDALAVFRELVRQAVLPADEKMNTLVLVSPAAVNVVVYSLGTVVALRSLVLGTHQITEPEIQTVIHEELQRTLVATEVEQPGKEIGRLTFATWAESLKPGVAELAQSWGANAELLSNGATPSPAVSICLESARRGAARLNLLPAEWRERRRTARVRQSLIRGGIALAALYVVAVIVFVMAMMVQKARVSTIESQIRKLQHEYDQSRTLHKTLVAMQKQLDTKYSSLEALREVSALLPDNVKLNGYSFKRDDSVTLRAQAQSATLAHDFIGRLEKSDMFSKVVTGSERTEPATSLTKFDVVCTLKSATAAPTRGGSWR